MSGERIAEDLDLELSCAIIRHHHDIYNDFG